MKALTWHGTHDVRVDTVPDPRIQDPGDAILKVTATAICGSDLHLYNGLMPAMEPGDVLGHEFMGEVVEVGKEVRNLKKGDRVVVPFTISCGHCFFCDKRLYSLCETSNPNAADAAQAMGHSPAALFGYSHLLGGIPGGQPCCRACPRAPAFEGAVQGTPLSHKRGGREGKQSHRPK